MENKILVIKPPYNTFPVGFAYVLACLENYKIPFNFIDTEFGHSYKKLLRKNDYFAVATGGLIGHFNFFREVIHQVHKIHPELAVSLAKAMGIKISQVRKASLDEIMMNKKRPKDTSMIPNALVKSNISFSTMAVCIERIADNWIKMSV